MFKMCTEVWQLEKGTVDMDIETMEITKELWWALVLGTGSFIDIRKKSLPKTFVAVICMVSTVMLVIGFFLSVSSISYMEAGIGAMIGGVVMVASFFSNGCIGMADAILVFITGLLFGYMGSIEVTLYAIFFAAIVSMILISFGKAGRKSHIPFIPFMFLGYVLYSIRTM